MEGNSMKSSTIKESTAEFNDKNEPVKMGTVENTDQPEVDREEIKKKATLLFLQGKRSIFIRDYQAALVALSESCQLFSQIYEEQDDAMADPYFYYGKALLEVGRNESDVLGDQVQEGDEGDDGDEEEEEDEEAEEENEQEKNGESKPETEENGNCSSNENGTSSKEKENEKCEKPDGGTQDGDEENGEINDLQLSWEYLELAKLIYLKKADTCKEHAIKLAETYLCLGENGLESENYAMAIEDIKQALELQRKHLNEEDRRIAETYYQLGVAHSLDQNFDEAISNFKNAIQQLEKKIASLELRKKIGDKKTEEEAKDAFYTMEGEIDEIRTVIRDVEEKIKDMLESKNKVKAELLKQVYGGGQSSSKTTDESQAGSSTAAVTDISHLIKRKRKNEENNAGEEKKLKPDN